MHLIFKKDTGEIVNLMSFSDESMLILNVGVDEDSVAIPHSIDINSHYVDTLTYTVVSKSQKPKDGFYFDYAVKDWVDGRSLSDAKAKKWVEIKKKREDMYLESFVFNGHTFQPNVPVITSNAQVAQLDLEGFSKSWLTVDNTAVILGGSDMINMALAVDTQHSEIFTKSQQLRLLIDACTTNEEVDAVTWDSL